jgi:hypothetical protein
MARLNSSETIAKATATAAGIIVCVFKPRVNLRS